MNDRAPRDRRRRNLPIWHPRRLHGRRTANRRDEAAGRPYLVDRVSGRMFVMASLLLVLTLVDGMMTVALIDDSAEEANPVMRALLELGPGAFFLGKYLLTALFLPLALVTNRYRLFGTRLRVGHLIPVIAALYLILIGYQTALLLEGGLLGPGTHPGNVGPSNPRAASVPGA